MSLTSPGQKVNLSCQKRGWLKMPAARPTDTTMLMNQITIICRKAFEQGGGGKVMASALGIHDEILLARLRVGYADKSLLAVIPGNGDVHDALGKLGLVGKDGGITISECLTVPVMDREGRASGFVAVDAQGGERRFPDTLPLYGINQIYIAGRSVVFTDSVLKTMLYLQAGFTDIVALSEIPGEAEETFLRLNRPQKAYCDVHGQGIQHAFQKLEVPCYRMKLDWPANQAQIGEAIKAAEPMQVRLDNGIRPLTGGSESGEAVATVLDESIKFRCGGRDYELCDLDSGETARMRVRLKAIRNDAFHLDTLDLYAARARANFARIAAGLYGVPHQAVESDLCLMIRKVEGIRAAERGGKRGKSSGYAMTSDEEVEALELLQQPDLLDRIVYDMGRLGYVGEAANKKLGYIITVSRKLQSPLCGAILSRAGAGKSGLMDVLAEMIPPDELVRFTRITPQALYYAEPGGLKHKVIMSGEDEGLLGSDYALRELISSKKIRLAIPLSDSDSGKLRTVEYEVEGPIALLFSTTKPAIHFENATRLVTLSLDESPEQTRQILEAQRRRHTIAGLEEKPVLEDLRQLHRNIQRMLKPLLVINPYAPHLKFPTQPLEMRREHEKYLSLIDAVALLYQHQREHKETVINGQKAEYIEVAIDDIEAANKLMAEILGTANEELSRPSRELLGHIKHMAEQAKEADAYRFNRRDIREFTGWSDSQIKSHIRRLEELEYLLVSKGERGRLYRYELARNGQQKQLPGLTDTAKLRAMAAQVKVRKSGIVCSGLAEGQPQNCVDKSKQTAGESLKAGQNSQKGGEAVYA